MSVEGNKEIARRYCSIGAKEFKEYRETGRDDFHAPEFVFHGPSGDMSLKEYNEFMDTMVTSFPDYKYTPEDIIAEGDKVVLRYTLTGTHQGNAMGIPPSRKKVKIEGIGILRIGGGKLVEAWFATDALGLMQQIGAIPSQ